MDSEFLRRSFREACQARGIDPEVGSNSFQAVEVQTQLRKSEWYVRQEALVRAHAQRVPLNYDNGQGEIDPITVQERASRQWWARSWLWNGYHALHRTFTYHDEFYETFQIVGQALQPTDVEAFSRLRDEAKALQAEVLRATKRQRQAAWRGIVREAMTEARWGVSFAVRGKAEVR